MRKLTVLALVILFVALGAMAAMTASTHSPPVTASTSLNNSMNITSATPSSQIAIAPTPAILAHRQIGPGSHVLARSQATTPVTTSDYVFALDRNVNTLPNVDCWTHWANLPPSTSTFSRLKARFEYPSSRASPTALREKKTIVIDRPTPSATARNAPMKTMRV